MGGKGIQVNGLPGRLSHEAFGNSIDCSKHDDDPEDDVPDMGTEGKQVDFDGSALVRPYSIEKSKGDHDHHTQDIKEKAIQRIPAVSTPSGTPF